MTTNTDNVSEPTRYTAQSVADAALKIVAIWRDNDDVPAGLVAELEALAASVREQTATKTNDIIDPEHIELVAAFLFEQNSDEPEWESWAELMSAENISERASNLIAEWRTKAKVTIVEMPAVPVNPARSIDSAIGFLADTVSVVANNIYTSQPGVKVSPEEVSTYLTRIVTEWAADWHVSTELKDQMIRLVVDKIEGPEMRTRLDDGLSTDLSSILRDRILSHQALITLRDHNASRSTNDISEESK